MTYVLGLTGSIGMGKSTTAEMFRVLDIPVWDADATVRKLYSKGGAVVAQIDAILPDVVSNGLVSREKLRQRIAEDPNVLDRIQEIVHPLVAADRQAFLDATDCAIVVLDIPLLYETGGDAFCDGVVVVTTDPDEQERRVLARGEMTKSEFQLILDRQIPDAEKQQRADWIIETTSIAAAEAAVKQILSEIRGRADA